MLFLDAVFQRLIFEQSTESRITYLQVMTWLFANAKIGIFSDMPRCIALLEQYFCFFFFDLQLSI